MLEESFVLEPGVPGSRYIDEYPALGYAEWLPTDSPIEGLNELGRRHRELLGTRARLGGEVAELVRRFDAEDKARDEAVKASVRSPEADVSLPDVTPEAERAPLVAEASTRAKAADEVLGEFFAEALTTIAESFDEWSAFLAGQQDAVVQARREAEQRLAEAQEAERLLPALQRFLGRSAGRASLPPVHWPALADWRPSDLDVVLADDPEPAESDDPVSSDVPHPRSAQSLAEELHAAFQ